MTILKEKEEEIVWLVEQHNSRELFGRIGRQGDYLLADFPGYGRLKAKQDGTAYSWTPASNAPSWLLEKFFRSHLEALLRHLNGKMTLHGGAVSIHGQAIALIGASGHGKSTLTAVLCQDEDVSLLADDTVAIEWQNGHPYILPTQTVTWLRDDAVEYLSLPSHSAYAPGYKIPLFPPRQTSELTHLRALIELQWAPGGTDPLLTLTKGRQHFLGIATHLFRFALHEPVHIRNEFQQIELLANQVPFYILSRPLCFSTLRESIYLLKKLVNPFQTKTQTNKNLSFKKF
ncbi:hypothetical protein [Pajaroellobacter abortibovis]|nr:hypothetical protein [Pajaroellobacter abortibovis]